MEKRNIYWETIGVRAEIASFAPEGKVEEFHVMLHVDTRGELFNGQLSRLYQGEELLMLDAQLQGACAIMKRYFLSDATNQQPLMKQDDSCAVSYIQQPCLDGSKVAVWIYLTKGTAVSQQHGATVSEHNGYQHIYQMGLVDNQGDSYAQTESVMNTYQQTLAQFGANMADNCVRTWFFVRDVDIQYMGMVQARKDLFTRMGLTEKTHYISSTGIGGVPADTKAIVQLGTYALTGFQPQQQYYLYAPTHLNPTYEYGVTFERGTVVEYGDRAHLYISGTASIDNKGNVLHVGDIVKQTQRMWENVEKLLEEGKSGFQDVMQIVVYLRDICDYQTVKAMFQERFPDIPTVFTLAPVCRPTWLVEMECIAVAQRDNGAYRDF